MFTVGHIARFRSNPEHGETTCDPWFDAIDDTIPWQVPGFITNFLFFWDPDLIEYGLLSAINNAKSGLPAVRGQSREDYLAIHGCFNLHIDEVNHRWDTW